MRTPSPCFKSMLLYAAVVAGSPAACYGAADAPGDGADAAADPSLLSDLYLFPTLKIPQFNLELAPQDDDDDNGTKLTPTIQTEFGVMAEWRGYRASVTAPLKR